jgi:hypothetical protein
VPHDVAAHERAWPELWPDTAIALAEQVAEKLGWEIEATYIYAGEWSAVVRPKGGGKPIGKGAAAENRHEAAWEALQQALESVD